MAARKPPFLLSMSVRNYRSLKAVDLKLGALNVLVGPNGAGKSNLLDVVRFLGDSARSDIRDALVSRGGFDRILFRGEREKQSITISVEAAVTSNSNRNAPDEYILNFRDMASRRTRDPSRAIVLRTETFQFKRTAGPGRRITLQGQDLRVFSAETLELELDLNEGSLALATLPKLGEQAGGKEVEAVASLFESFRVFDIDVDKARLPSSSLVSDHLESDASNLASFLMYLSQSHAMEFMALVDDARAFIPGLRDIVFKAIGGAKEARAIVLIEGGLAGETPLADASYGSIRALALLALLYDPRPPKLTCIEEIDHGLHPYVLDRLVELIRSASERTQLIVATHSPSLVNRLSPEELIVCERSSDGSSRIPAISPDVVREMEKSAEGELGLGELWFSGVLGGVPD